MKLNILHKQAELLSIIRDFFANLQALEVQTPLLADAPVTDPYLKALTIVCHDKLKYLQTSPEYAMKRLLAAGSGCIYQICKAFRAEEAGALHNPEFTMLEWYRVGFDAQQLMSEVDSLLQLTLSQPAEKISYKDLLQSHLGINPHQINLDELAKLAKSHDIEVLGSKPDKTDYLQLLIAKLIEPTLGQNSPICIYDYPKEQAALAKLKLVDGIEVASRFEVYYQGIELANGYHELTDAKEQRRRFKNDLSQRQHMGLEQVPIDESLLDAMSHGPGLPECAGVALGLDRLLMLKLGLKKLSILLTNSL